MNRNYLIIVLALSSMLMWKCHSNLTGSHSGEGLIPEKENFSKIVDGKPVNLYVLNGSDRFSVALTNYGGRIVGIYLPDANGDLTDVVLGFDSILNYIESPDPYFGPIVGMCGKSYCAGYIHT